MELHWRLSKPAWRIDLDPDQLWLGVEQQEWMGRPVLGDEVDVFRTIVDHADVATMK